MSGNQGYRWDDPYRTGINGTYDPGTIKGLILRAQQGDLAARNHLKEAGFYGNFGQDVWGDTSAGNYDPAINAWAQSKNLQPFTGQGFQWNQNYASGDPSFASAWNSFFGGQPAQQPTTQPTQPTQQPTTPPANQGEYSYYTPTTPGGRFIAGAGVADHYDPNAKYTWGIRQGDRMQNGIAMPATYDGTKDHARWSYAQNPNESSWDHWDRLTHDLMKNYGMGQQQAADEALKEMYANYQAQGRDWSETGFTPPAGVQAAPQPGTTPAAGGGGTTPAPAAGGGTTPTPAAGGGTTPTAGGTTPATTGADGGLTRRVEMANNPAVQLQYVMDQLGINTDRPGLFADDIQSAVKQSLTPYMQVGSVFNNDYMDTAQGLLDKYVGMLQSPGGFGQIAQVGQNIANDPRWKNDILANLSASDALNAMRQQTALSLAPINPLMSAAYQGAWNQAFGANNQGGQFARASLDNPNLRPDEWLMNSPWAALLNNI